MQQGKWAHRVVLLKERLQNQGIFFTLLFCWQRIRNMLFSHCVFGRGDINVHHDAHVGGVEQVEWSVYYLKRFYQIS